MGISHQLHYVQMHLTVEFVTPPHLDCSQHKLSVFKKISSVGLVRASICADIY